MSEELEPVSGDEIEPTAVYGPDDWRPYSPPDIDLRAVVDHILYGMGQEERRKSWDTLYDAHAAAEYSDPQNVRERDRTPDEYAYTGLYLRPALLAAQRRMQARIEFGMRLQDPKNIIKGMGTEG